MGERSVVAFSIKSRKPGAASKAAIGRLQGNIPKPGFF
jgi:hypothetical protein